MKTQLDIAGGFLMTIRQNKKKLSNDEILKRRELNERINKSLSRLLRMNITLALGRGLFSKSLWEIIKAAQGQ